LEHDTLDYASRGVGNRGKVSNWRGMVACSLAAAPPILFYALWSDAANPDIGAALGCWAVLLIPFLNLVGMGFGAAGAAKSEGRIMLLALLGFTLHLVELLGFAAFVLYTLAHR
jgi:hypothetical protein